MLRKTRRYFIVLNKGNDIIKEIGPFRDHIEAEDAHYELCCWFDKKAKARINYVEIVRENMQIVCEKEVPICIDCITPSNMDLELYGHLLLSC